MCIFSAWDHQIFPPGTGKGRTLGFRLSLQKKVTSRYRNPNSPELRFGCTHAHKLSPLLLRLLSVLQQHTKNFLVTAFYFSCRSNTSDNPLTALLCRQIIPSACNATPAAIFSPSSPKAWGASVIPTSKADYHALRVYQFSPDLFHERLLSSQSWKSPSGAFLSVAKHKGKGSTTNLNHAAVERTGASPDFLEKRVAEGGHPVSPERPNIRFRQQRTQQRGDPV